MRLCASGHEAIVHDGAVLGPRDDCPLCAANQSLAETLAEVSRLEGRAKDLSNEIAALHVQLDRAYGACQH